MLLISTYNQRSQRDDSRIYLLLKNEVKPIISHAIRFHFLYLTNLITKVQNFISGNIIENTI